MPIFTDDKALILAARLRQRMNQYRERKSAQVKAMQSLAAMASQSANHFRHSFLNAMG